MRVLFDQATPVPIREFLIGHTVRTATQEHWDTLRNGDLLTAAEEAGFDVFLTTDQNLQYQQNLTGRTIAIGRGCAQRRQAWQLYFCGVSLTRLFRAECHARVDLSEGPAGQLFELSDARSRLNAQSRRGIDNRRLSAALHLGRPAIDRLNQFGEVLDCRKWIRTHWARCLPIPLALWRAYEQTRAPHIATAQAAPIAIESWSLGGRASIGRLTLRTRRLDSWPRAFGRIDRAC
ncbi:MAG: hypothetical protein RLZZ53_1939 [Acidobacteriota bacterium]